MKRIILSIILLLAMFLGMTACGREESIMSEEAKKTVFRLDSGVKFEDFVSGVNQTDLIGDYIVTYADVYSDGEDPYANMQEVFYAVPKTGGKNEKIYSMPLSGYIRNITDCNGNIGIIYSEIEEDSENSKLYFDIIDVKGNVISKNDITEYGSEGDSFMVSSVTAGKDGNYYFCFNDFIIVYDTSFNKIGTVKIDGNLIGVRHDSEGKIVAVFDSEGTFVGHIDIASGTVTDKHKLGLTSVYSIDNLCNGNSEYDFYIKTDNGIYGYDMDTEEEIKLCDYTNSDIMVGNTRRVAILDSQNIFVYTDNEDGVSGAGEIYKKVDPAEVKDKKILTLMCQYADSDLKRAVIEYNKAHPDYKISIVDYSEFDDSDAKISADIAAGKIPDIYYSYAGIGRMSLSQCVAKGMLEDMIPYIEKDPELSVEDFVPNVLEAMKINGGLYFFSPSFDVKTVAANGNIVKYDSQETWNFQEMKATVDEFPDDVMIFEERTKMEILRRFTYTSMDDFVDWDKGDCSFDSEDFKDILTMADRGLKEEPEYEEGGASLFERIQSGEQLFADISFDPNDFMYNDNLFQGNMVIVGYPNASRNGVLAQMTNGYAISSACKNKDAAWEFVRHYITREYQGSNYVNGYMVFPLRQDILDMKLEALKTTESYTDEFGNMIDPKSGTIGWGDSEVELKPFTDEQVEAIRHAIGKVNKVWLYDTSLQGIIEEEVQAYFAGDKSLDDTVYVIQNRASTYIKENK